MQIVKMQPGSWFNAKAVEDAVTDLNEEAGNLGYAFADINPAYDRDADKQLMNVTFKVGETPRVYVERIDITGNTTTRDKVIRREFRLNEGDAFNALKVKRSQDRIQSLGFFQDKLEIKQTEGSAPDRVVLGVECRGEADRPAVAVGRLFEPRALRRPARGFAEQLHGQGPAARRLGQLVALFEVGRARLRRSLFPRQADPVRRPAFPPRLPQLQLSSATTATRPTRRSAPAAACGLGFPLTEYWNFGTRYSLVQDKITLDKSTFYTDPDGPGRCPQCDPLKAGTLSVRRNRHAADLARSAIRRFTTTPTGSIRRAASG